MLKKTVLILGCALLFAKPSIAGDDFYYVANDSISVEISDEFIAMQFDTMTVIPSIGSR